MATKKTKETDTSKKKGTKVTKKNVVSTKETVVKKQKKVSKIQDKEVEKNIIQTNESEIKKNNGFYFNYTSRIIFRIIMLLLLLFIGTYLILKTVYLEAGEVVSYTEKSNVNYLVCLNENNFYENSCLPKNMKYVASLIDKIKVDFNYLFNIDEEKDIEFIYNIEGKLIIKDRNGKSFYEKDYVLLNDKNVKIDKQNAEIKETLDINYDDYNSRANLFKSSYGIDAESYLIVKMNIIKNPLNKEDRFSINTDSSLYLTIPLSEKAIDVELNFVDINRKSSVISKEKLSVKNGLYVFAAGVCIFFGLSLLINTMRKYSVVNKNKEYDKYIKKILKEYDRLIAESKTIVSFEDKEVIKVNNFNELLDIHDNLTLPIMYYNVTSHIKCYFYIVHQNIVYLYTVKSIDLEKKN